MKNQQNIYYLRGHLAWYPGSFQSAVGQLLGCRQGTPSTSLCSGSSPRRFVGPQKNIGCRPPTERSSCLRPVSKSLFLSSIDRKQLGNKSRTFENDITCFFFKHIRMVEQLLNNSMYWVCIEFLHKMKFKNKVEVANSKPGLWVGGLQLRYVPW